MNADAFLICGKVLIGLYAFWYLAIPALARKDYQLFGLGAASLLYPLGSLSQLFLGMPQMIRWHLADVGGVAFFTMLLLHTYTQRGYSRRSAPHLIGLALLVFLGCVAFEMAPSLMLRPDYNDLAAYGLGFIITSAILCLASPGKEKT